MKRKTSTKFLILVITLTFMSLQYQHPVTNVSGQTTEDIRVLRLMLDTPDVTFSQNDTVFIYMSLENVVSEPLYDVSFNLTGKEHVYEIESSSNSSQSSNEFVTYQFNKLNIHDKVTFNATLKITSNATSATETIDALAINYKIGEFRLNQTILTPSFSITISNPITDKKALPERTFGTAESDTLIFVIFFAFPVALGLLLSFLFGRRQNK